VIQLKLDVVLRRRHKFLHFLHRRQHPLAFRLGPAFNPVRFRHWLPSSRSTCFIRSGGRRYRTHPSPAVERPHIHGFSSTQDKAGEESPLPPPVIPLACLSPAG